MCRIEINDIKRLKIDKTGIHAILKDGMEANITPEDIMKIFDIVPIEAESIKSHQ